MTIQALVHRFSVPVYFQTKFHALYSKSMAISFSQQISNNCF